MYDLRNIKGHIEVYVGGEFILAADSYAEALDELSALDKECEE